MLQTSVLPKRERCQINSLTFYTKTLEKEQTKCISNSRKKKK